MREQGVGYEMHTGYEMSSDRSNGRVDIGAILAERESERYGLHAQHMNEMMVRVLQTIGFDVGEYNLPSVVGESFAFDVRTELAATNAVFVYVPKRA